MLSAAEPALPSTPSAEVASRGAKDLFLRWNRRLHYYLGLFLLFFIWLFSFTGLLLNHSQWKFAEFWSNRRQATFERAIAAPAPGSDLAQARDLMRQLAVRGEVEWTASRADAREFEFRVSQPGHILEVKADLPRGHATVKRTDLNAWGVVRILHTFTGVRRGDSRNDRDWVLTTVWALAMDAVAAGLILLALGGILMWYEARQQRLLGALALTGGVLSCGWFCAGLRCFS